MLCTTNIYAYVQNNNEHTIKPADLNSNESDNNIVVDNAHSFSFVAPDEYDLYTHNASIEYEEAMRTHQSSMSSLRMYLYSLFGSMFVYYLEIKEKLNNHVQQLKDFINKWYNAKPTDQDK